MTLVTHWGKKDFSHKRALRKQLLETTDNISECENPHEKISLSLCEPFSAITFGNSRRAAQLNGSVPIYVSQVLNRKLGGALWVQQHGRIWVIVYL